MSLNIDMNGTPQEISDRIIEATNALVEVDNSFGDKIDNAVAECDLEELFEEYEAFSIDELMGEEGLDDDKKFEILSLYINKLEEQIS